MGIKTPTDFNVVYGDEELDGGREAGAVSIVVTEVVPDVEDKTGRRLLQYSETTTARLSVTAKKNSSH